MAHIERWHPMPPYFFIRIPKKEQRERLEKIGVLYFPPEYAYMKRGMQCGEIIGIGEDAHNYFPEAKVGDIALFHHFAEFKKDEKGNRFFFLYDDEDYNYYAITVFTYNGDRNMCYGVWNGGELIPNKDYIFLEVEKESETDVPDLKVQSNLAGEGSWKVDMAMRVTKTGLIIPKEKKVSRESIVSKMKENTFRIKQLSNGKRMTDEVIREVQRLENENAKYSNEINKRKYENYTIAAINPEFNEGLEISFGMKLYPGETIAMLNIACHTQIEFNKREYIVSETQYSAGPVKWYEDAVLKFKQHSTQITTHRTEPKIFSTAP